jgi:hypothetical protein
MSGPRRIPPESFPDAGGIDLDERKERVLHTRVPQSLDRQLRHRARNLGLSVSTVVRHVLLNTFGLVEDIVTDTTNVALSVAGEDAEPGARSRIAGRRSVEDESAQNGIVGWQEAVLNLNAVCAHCNAVLRRGARAAIGIRTRPGQPTFLCNRCVRKVEDAERGPAASQRRKPRHRARPAPPRR